jgi:hypothetical protein
MRTFLLTLSALATTASIATAATPPTIAVANLTLTPQVTQLGDAVTDMGFDKLLRVAREPECAYYITRQPIAILDVRTATPQLHIALHGDVSGIVVKLDHAFWTACADDKHTATLGKTAEGWQPGRYEVYAGSRQRREQPSHVELSVFDPDYVSPADAAAAPTGPVELALPDDMTQPVAIEIAIPAGHPRWYPVTLTTTTKRHVVVVALGGPDAGVGNQSSGSRGHVLDARGLNRGEWSGIVKPDQPLSFDAYGVGGSKVYVVAAEPHVTVVDAAVTYGLPAATARAHDRALEHYSLLPYLSPLRPFEVTRESADAAGRLFATIDPSLVLWVADDDHCKHILTEGEPVILLPAFNILHANGQVTECRAWKDDELTTTKPAAPAMPSIVEPRSDQAQAIWSDEDFLKLTDRDVVAYKAVKQKARACNDAMWTKLDPDGKSGNYDIVTYVNGKPTKIEGADDRIFRKVYDACGLATVEAKRAAIYKRLSKTFRTDEQHRLDAIAKRFQ